MVLITPEPFCARAAARRPPSAVDEVSPDPDRAAASHLYRFTMKNGMIKPELYTKEPYPITEAELREREEREAKAKEERLRAEFTAFVERMRKNRQILDNFLQLWYNVGVKYPHRGYTEKVKCYENL